MADVTELWPGVEALARNEAEQARLDEERARKAVELWAWCLDNGIVVTSIRSAGVACPWPRHRC